VTHFDGNIQRLYLAPAALGEDEPVDVGSMNQTAIQSHYVPGVLVQELSGWVTGERRWK